MKLSNIAALYKKELLELFRDRRTLISMVVVPLAAIPLMFTAMNHFMNSAEKQARDEAVVVAVTASTSPDILDALKAAGVKPEVKTNLRAAVEKKEVPAALDETQTPAGDKQVRVYVDHTRQASSIAGDKIRAALEKLKNDTVRSRLRQSGISEKVLTPFTIERVNVASEEKMSGMVFGSALGYIMILLMFTGAMYPAIDMTAGEKERRTMEALISTPASREEIVFSKIFAAATAAFITGVLTLGSMAQSLRVAPQGSNSPLHLHTPDMQTLGLVLITVIPTAFVAASLMVAIALFAKSYKEGQSYLTPLIMLVAFPALAGMMPGLELTPLLALIPIFNVCQLIKEIFLGDFSRVAFAIAFVSNLVYAGIACVIAARIFRSESVLFRT